MNTTHVSLPGSRRPAKRDAQRVGDVDPRSRIEVTVDLRAPALPAPEPGLRLTREQLAANYGASKGDADKVTDVLRGYGLDVEDVSLETHSIRVSGTADVIENAFRPHLAMYHSDSQGTFRGREHDISVPADLAGIVVGIHGLDERRVARRKETIPSHAIGAATPLTPSLIESLYKFPAGDGAGEQIAIAEFGGGYFDDDLAAYCTKFGRPKPSVKTVSVGLPALTLQQIMQLPAQQRSEELDESGEVMMDVEIIAGLCPRAEIFVYFAPFTQKGWVDLLNQIVAGNPAKPITLSISWGLAEDAQDWTSGARNAINNRLQALALLGITVCVSSGDDGSGDHINDGRGHVDFPSCSPFVLSVGGTMVHGSNEIVWNDPPGQRRGGGGATGGGISIFFNRPSWQKVQIASINQPSIDGRVMPDVAAIAGAPGYTLVLLGHTTVSGGTSASAPLWAALIARINAQLPAAKKQQFLTPLLYTDVGGKALGFLSCRDVTSGNNTSDPEPAKGYKANVGFDAVCGWGVPDGTALLQRLS